jgi:cell shape-determining protein MreC
MTLTPLVGDVVHHLPLRYEFLGFGLGEATDARVAKTGQVGVVEGSYNTGLILDQLPQSAELEKDWLVVTAGINSVIPKDIPIGEVGEVISSGNDLFKKASLLSPVDFNNLQFVYIVK